MMTHDKDSSGFLDKKEAKAFLKELYLNIGLRDEMFSDDDFD